MHPLSIFSSLRSFSAAINAKSAAVSLSFVTFLLQIPVFLKILSGVHFSNRFDKYSLVISAVGVAKLILFIVAKGSKA